MNFIGWILKPRFSYAEMALLAAVLSFADGWPIWLVAIVLFVGVAITTVGWYAWEEKQRAKAGVK